MDTIIEIVCALPTIMTGLIGLVGGMISTVAIAAAVKNRCGHSAVMGGLLVAFMLGAAGVACVFDAEIALATLTAGAIFGAILGIFRCATLAREGKPVEYRLADGTVLKCTGRPVVTGQEYVVVDGRGVVTRWVAEADAQRVAKMNAAELAAFIATEDAKYW